MHNLKVFKTTENHPFTLCKVYVITRYPLMAPTLGYAMWLAAGLCWHRTEVIQIPCYEKAKFATLPWSPAAHSTQPQTTTLKWNIWGTHHCCKSSALQALCNRAPTFTQIWVCSLPGCMYLYVCTTSIHVIHHSLTQQQLLEASVCLENLELHWLNGLILFKGARDPWLPVSWLIFHLAPNFESCYIRINPDNLSHPSPLRGLY